MTLVAVILNPFLPLDNPEAAAEAVAAVKSPSQGSPPPPPPPPYHL